jgi:hypothetical protein
MENQPGSGSGLAYQDMLICGDALEELTNNNNNKNASTPRAEMGPVAGSSGCHGDTDALPPTEEAALCRAPNIFSHYKMFKLFIQTEQCNEFLWAH